MEAITQFIPVGQTVSLHIRREDLLNPLIPGNKLRKLKYNLARAKAEGHDCLLTFGGAYSNHISAVAQAGKLYGFKTIGIIRGDELSTAINKNPTLRSAENAGMTLKFISRESYRNKGNHTFYEQLKNEFGRFYLIPEGGTNALAVKGCEEILTDGDADFDYICVASGTGGTAAGIINSASGRQQVLVFPAVKGDFIEGEILKFSPRRNWKIIDRYHFGGYAKISRDLVEFINGFYAQTGIPLDPVYTGKLLFGVMDLIAKDYFPRNSKILVIHTGGIQGIAGINQKLKNKNLPLIQIDV